MDINRLLYYKFTSSILVYRLRPLSTSSFVDVHFVIPKTMRRTYTGLLVPQRPMKEVAEQNFWFRARRLANLCPIKLNEFGLKNKLLTWMWIVFVKSFSESNLCSWKTYCDCTTCRLLVNT